MEDIPMALMRFDPFRELDRLTERVAGERPLRTMPMEAFRRGEEFYVVLDAPGVAPDDIDVTVERNVVTINARRQPVRQDGDEVLIDERPHGDFTRQLFLGDNLDTSKVGANVELGVLTLTIPVAKSSKPRRVQIGPSSERQPVETSQKATANAQA
jgi:HSP20 family protein